MSFDFSLVHKQTIDFKQINIILSKSYQSIKSAELTLDSDCEASFTLSYESMLKTSLALMLSRGYRPRVQLGHHKTLVLYAKYVLRQFSSIIATYDRMRQKRNKLIYDIASVGKTEAKQALLIAKRYFDIVEDKIAKDNPQQKLWKYEQKISR